MICFRALRRPPRRPGRAIIVSVLAAGVAALSACGSKSGEEARAGGDRRDVITSANPVIDDAHGPSPILKKDPFVIKANANARGPVTRRNSSQEIGPPAVEPRAVAATSVDGAGEELTLKAILMGNRPAAIIDGRIVRVGDRLDTSDGECHYNVTAITRDTVSLLAEWPKTGETKPITLGLDVKVADG